MEEKTPTHFHQPNAFAKLAFGSSMMSKGAREEAANSVDTADPNSIEWPNVNLTTTPAQTELAFFSSIHGLPAMSLRSVAPSARSNWASIAETLRFRDWRLPRVLRTQRV